MGASGCALRVCVCGKKRDGVLNKHYNVIDNLRRFSLVPEKIDLGFHSQ